MKVAMLTPVVWGAPGPDSLREDQAALLAGSLMRRGLDVMLLAAANGGEATGRGNGAGWLRCPDMARLFERSHEFDLIHSHLELPPAACRNLNGTPLLTTIYGGPAGQSHASRDQAALKSFYVAAGPTANKKASDFLATIYPGVDLSYFTFQPDRDEYLLFCGPIRADSGIRKSLEIAEQSGRRLILTGTVEDPGFFQREVEPHLVGGRVIFVDAAGPEQRRDLLRRAYALLLPNGPTQPCSVAAAQALACGTPVLAVDQGSLSGIVDHGTSGFLADDHAVLANFVPQVASLDRRECRRRAEERFGSDRLASDYLDVYRRVLEQMGREDHRPWGFYEILVGAPDHQVKRITVYPGQRLSYQRHFQRSEHWFVLNGTAVVTRNGRTTSYAPGRSVEIPVGTWHRVWNPGDRNMVFIEVQTGDYFGEDDIERLEDDYGRV